MLVGAFALEANTFAPGRTTLADFEAQIFGVGGEIHPALLGPRSELAAAWRVLAAAGCNVVPAVAAWSGPRQVLAREALDEIVRLAVAPCDERIDGAYFMLHGSAVAEGDDDPEGTLLAALRRRLGPGKPIAISLDCHANLTELMVSSVDAVAVYRTCPHLDTDRTGEQAAAILVDALAGRRRPVVAMAGRPMITPADLHDNEREPFRGLMARCGEVERDGVLAAGLLMVQPWIDVPGLGWKAVVTADGDLGRARRTAEELIEAAWEARHGFLAGRRPPIDQALAEALAAEPPVVLADAGDATNGGSIGDSTELLRAALRRDSTARILLTVVAPAAAAAAHEAGAGAELTVELGGGPPGAYNERVRLPVVVERLFDGILTYTHPVNEGYRAATGKAALLRSGTLEIVAHTRSVGVIDPAIYEALGADLAAMDVIQAKSHVSFKTGFARISARTVVADTDGPTTGNLTRLSYERRPRPLFPFEDR